jgi:hypothetical protein
MKFLFPVIGADGVLCEMERGEICDGLGGEVVEKLDRNCAPV